MGLKKIKLFSDKITNHPHIVWEIIQFSLVVKFANYIINQHLETQNIKLQFLTLEIQGVVCLPGQNIHLELESQRCTVHQLPLFSSSSAFYMFSRSRSSSSSDLVLIFFGVLHHLCSSSPNFLLQIQFYPSRLLLLLLIWIYFSFSSTPFLLLHLQICFYGTRVSPTQVPRD